MSKRHDNSYFIEENSQNFKKQCTIRLFLNTSQEPMVGPVIDDEAVTLPTQMGLVHDPPNLSVPQNFDSPDGFMEDDGFNCSIQEGWSRRQGSQLSGILEEGIPMALLRQDQGSFLLPLVILGPAEREITSGVPETKIYIREAEAHRCGVERLQEG